MSIATQNVPLHPSLVAGYQTVRLTSTGSGDSFYTHDPEIGSFDEKRRL